MQVLFATKLELPKIPVPRLRKNISNVNIESPGKSKQLCYLRDQLLGALIHHCHNKRKDSLEGSLDRVFFAAEVEFRKILVPRLPQ